LTLPLAAGRRVVSQAKQVALLALGTVSQELGEHLKAERGMAHEEVVSFLSDMIMDVYAMESALLRAAKFEARGDTGKATIAAAMASLYCNDGIARLENRARNVLAAVCQGDALATALERLRRIAEHRPVNTVALRRRIADALIEREAWPF
jgi:hypothetical protein